MFNPAPPPAGSTIQRIDEGGVTIYRWREAKIHPARLLMLGITGLWAVGLCFTVVMLFSGVFDQPVGGMPADAKIFLVGMSILALAFFVVPLLIPRAPESVTFDDDIVHHDTGSPPLPLPLMLFLGPMSVQLPHMFGPDHTTHWRRRRRTLPRGAVSNISLERVGERQRLTFDHGADRIEIGGCLREPEREWLADVLREWAESSRG